MDHIFLFAGARLHEVVINKQ